MNKEVIGQIRAFERGDYVKVSWFDASVLEDEKISFRIVF